MVCSVIDVVLVVKIGNGIRLASVPAEQAQVCIQELQALGYRDAAIIGAVQAQRDALEPIVLQA